MKILVTGASGRIATILREIFANDEVTLLSRTRLTPSGNERWFISGNLQNPGWWNSLPLDSVFDVVFHLAEPVKQRVNNKIRERIIDEHVIFVSYFANQGAKVIYPLTAYSYDKKLSRSNRTYAEIKHAVYGRLNGNRNVSFPILHPIFDSDYGLGKLIQMERRIPFINTMCAFESTIPVLRLEHLTRILSDPVSMPHGRFDTFTEILTIGNIFKDEARTNVFVLSRAILYVLVFLRFVPSIRLLTEGRNISNSADRVDLGNLDSRF